MNHAGLDIRFDEFNKFGNFKFINSYSIMRFFNSVRSYITFIMLNLNFNFPFSHKPFLNKKVLFKSKTISAKSYLSAIRMWVKIPVILIPNCETKSVNFIKNFFSNNFFFNGIERSVNLIKKGMRNRMIKVMPFLVFAKGRGFNLLKDIFGKRFFPINIVAKLTANGKSSASCRLNKCAVSQERAIDNLFGCIIEFFNIVFLSKRITFVRNVWFKVPSIISTTTSMTKDFVFSLWNKLYSTIFAYPHNRIVYIIRIVLSSKILRDFTLTLRIAR